jgi:diguanylate cyclase (GGDEF)-like protein/PAS domain S-box-containing protein
MGPVAERSVAELLSVGAESNHFDWIGLCLDNSDLPLIHPEESEPICDVLPVAQEILGRYGTELTDISSSIKRLVDSGQMSGCEEFSRPEFCVGINVFDTDNEHQGALFFLDRQPKELDEQQKRFIERLLALTEHHVEADKIRALQNQLEEKDQQLSLLSEVARQTSNGVVVTDAQGRVTWINRGFQKITGFSLSEMLGKKPGHVLQGDMTAPETKAYMHDQIRHRRRFDAEVINYYRNGTPYWVRIQCEPLYCSDGVFKGFLAIQTDIDSEKKHQSRLEHSLKLNQAILETLHDAVVTTDIRGQIKTVNPSLERMFGYSRSTLIGESISKLMPAQVASEHGHYMREYAARKGRSSSEIMGNLRSVKGQKADGTVFPLRIAVTETTANSEPLLVAAIHDITESEEAKIGLERFRQTLDSTLDCVFMFDSESFQFIYVNRGAIEQLGFSEHELLKMHPYDIKPEFNTFDKFQRMVAPLKNGDISHLKFQTEHQCKGGQRLPVEVSLQYVALDGDLPRFVAVVRDITEQQFHEETIERLAYYDPLTDLPNRRRIRKEIKATMAANAEKDVYGAILLTDLDEFKSVNDTLGHRSGDRLLVELARRYQQAVSDGDTVSRLGGDEFLVVLKDLHSDPTAAAEKAKDIAQGLLDSSSKPTKTLGTAKQVSTSVGIVLYKDEPASVSDLMRMADIAMYDAKRKGKDCYSVFDDTMQQNLLGEERLVSDLKLALSCEDQLVPWFQPKVDQYGTFSGFEALVRWHHPEKGFLAPGQFIELAEAKNLIVALGDLVLEQSCRQMATWREQFPIDEWTVAVNISQKQPLCVSVVVA